MDGAGSSYILYSLHLASSILLREAEEQRKEMDNVMTKFTGKCFTC